MATDNPSRTLRVVFSGEGSVDQSFSVEIENPDILGPAVREQLRRMGIVPKKGSTLSGHIKGRRRFLTDVLETYGYTVEEARPDSPDDPFQHEDLTGSL
jgi:hypothetical protein